jgi:hypothetical protein
MTWLNKKELMQPTIKSGVEDNKIVCVRLQKNLQRLDTGVCLLMSEPLKQTNRFVK